MSKLKKLFFNSEMDLTTGNLFSKLILFSLPILLTNICQLLFTSADLIIVSNFGGGYNSMSAVGANNPLINLVVILFVDISVGVNVVIANARGADNKEKCEKALHTAVWLSLIFGVVVGAVGVIFAKTFLQWMNVDPQILDLATTYLRWYFAGLPFVMFFNFATAALRALGDSVKPMIALFVCGIVNICLNLVFVIVFKMDVAGVGVATFISQGVSAITVFFFLFLNKNGYVKFNIKKFIITPSEVKDILKFGLPAGLQSFAFSIANVLIQSEANKFGTLAMAGNTASNAVEGYLYAFCSSISFACTAMVAQNLGAKKYKNIKKAFLYSVGLTSGITLTLGALSSIFSVPLLRIFIGQSTTNATDVEQALNFGRERLTLMGISYLLNALMNVSCGFMRGIKKTAIPTIITVFFCTILRAVYIYAIYRNIPDCNLFQLYLCMPVSWLLAILAYAAVIPFEFKKLKNTLCPVIPEDDILTERV